MTGARALDVLDAIKRLTEQRGYPPAIRELCDEVGISSTSTMHAHLHALADGGFITFEPGKSRTVVIK